MVSEPAAQSKRRGVHVSVPDGAQEGLSGLGADNIKLKKTKRPLM